MKLSILLILAVSTCAALEIKFYQYPRYNYLLYGANKLTSSCQTLPHWTQRYTRSLKTTKCVLLYSGPNCAGSEYLRLGPGHHSDLGTFNAKTSSFRACEDVNRMSPIHDVRIQLFDNTYYGDLIVDEPIYPNCTTLYNTLWDKTTSIRTPVCVNLFYGENCQGIMYTQHAGSDPYLSRVNFDNMVKSFRPCFPNQLFKSSGSRIEVEDDRVWANDQTYRRASVPVPASHLRSLTHFPDNSSEESFPIYGPASVARYPTAGIVSGSGSCKCNLPPPPVTSDRTHQCRRQNSHPDGTAWRHAYEGGITNMHYKLAPSKVNHELYIPVVTHVKAEVLNVCGESRFNGNPWPIRMRQVGAVLGQPNSIDDEAGHIIESSFCSPTKWYNLAPQRPQVHMNSGDRTAKRNRETSIQDYVRCGCGRVVIDVHLMYSDEMATRPSAFLYCTQFLNQHRQEVWFAGEHYLN